MFDTAEQMKSKGNREAIKKLRHRGKSRHYKNYVELRGKIPISNSLSECPKEANERKSRFLICRKLERKSGECVKYAMIEALNG